MGKYSRKELHDYNKKVPYTWYCHRCHVETANYFRFQSEHKDHEVSTTINFLISPLQLDNMIISK